MNGVNLNDAAQFGQEDRRRFSSQASLGSAMLGAKPSASPASRVMPSIASRTVEAGTNDDSHIRQKAVGSVSLCPRLKNPNRPRHFAGGSVLMQSGEDGSGSSAEGIKTLNLQPSVECVNHHLFQPRPFSTRSRASRANPGLQKV